MLPAVAPVNGSGSPRIAIIGAGFSGIGMAMRLKQAGITSFTIYEAAPEVGGTWFHNSYPGAACDIGSHLYSFSFKRNHEWTKTYAGHEEILEYLKACMREEDLYPQTRLSTPIESAAYDDASCTWTNRCAPTSPASTTSRATCSTRPAGTTTTTSRASGSR